MGSPAHLVIGGGPGLADLALTELERLEACWSRFRRDSELNALHRGAGQWCPVSGTLLNALVRARELWLATAGAFDPTVRAALERLGYDRSFELFAEAGAATRTGGASPPAATEALSRAPASADAPACVEGAACAEGAAGADGAAAGPVPGFGLVDIDEARRRVRVPEGVAVDLGGLGKGLAADLVAARLIDAGARSVCLSLGGDVRAAGDPPDGAWRIPVEDPFDEARTAFWWPLTEGAIVTSTVRYRRWRRNGRALHHLVDPATGQPADEGVAAVVCAGNSAARAEAFAKAALVRGADAGAALLIAGGLRGWIYPNRAEEVASA